MKRGPAHGGGGGALMPIGRIGSQKPLLITTLELVTDLT